MHPGTTALTGKAMQLARIGSARPENLRAKGVTGFLKLSFLVVVSVCFLGGWSAPVNAACGDGTVDGAEACDLGQFFNGLSSVCCSATCTLVVAGTECRPVAGECDVAETCSGTNPLCPSNSLAAAGTTCQEADACNDEASCTGTSAACPDSAKSPTIFGTAESETIDGTSEDDVIDATQGGNDRVKPRGGNDCVFTGTGTDRVDSSPGDDIVVDAGSPAKKPNLLKGGEDNDILEGGDGPDKIDGDDNEDTLIGNGGNDVLRGGDDDDDLAGGPGGDCLKGGDDTTGSGGPGDVCDGGPGDDCCLECDGNETSCEDLTSGDGICSTLKCT